ncbi:hypothetical protein ACFY0G_11230 [Streptomyces sp. NPDC001552]|uniref:hypothetical protein n=1 Tax=Streptomyces sp. NPDC001552 TaxID=3364587 RepID=UPI003691A2C2
MSPARPGGVPQDGTLHDPGPRPPSRTRQRTHRTAPHRTAPHRTAPQEHDPARPGPVVHRTKRPGHLVHHRTHGPTDEPRPTTYARRGTHDEVRTTQPGPAP